MNLELVGASLYLACGLAVFLLGLLVYRESPDNRVHRVSALMLMFGGLGPALGGLGTLIASGNGESAVLGDGLISSFAYVWEFFFPSLLLFALVFPQESTALKRFPRLPLLLYAPHLFHLVFVIFLSMAGDVRENFNLSSLVGGGEGALASSITLLTRIVAFLFDTVVRLHLRFFSLVNLVYVGLALVVLGKSWRRIERPKLRRQLAAILFGLASCMGLYILAVPIPNLFDWKWPKGVSVILVSFGLLLGTGSIAFAIVRQSFLDLGAVMRRAILLSGISGGLVVVYFATARPMDRLFLAEVGVGFPVFQTLYVILVIVFFHPLLGRVEEGVDRMVGGDRAAPRNLLRQLGRDMTSILDLETLTTTLLTTLKDALAIDSAHLVLLDQDDGRYRTEDLGEGARLELDTAHPLIARMTDSHDPMLARDAVDETTGERERGAVRETLAALRARLLIPIHLPESDGCIGFLSLGAKATGGRFNVEEMTLLSILSTQVGIAIRNARFHEEAVARKIVDQELAMARSIQENILSDRHPSLNGLDVAALSIPSRQVGGDYYDLVAMEQGCLGVAIGDVSGKGIPAALVMSMLHAGLHAQINGSALVADVASRMNRILYHSTSHEKFATFFFGVYEPEQKRLQYTNAGHNYPLVIRGDGSVSRLREGGLILGVMEDSSYQEASVGVDPGDLLVFYTDGVTEAGDTSEQEYGESRLLDAIRRSPGRRAQEIVDEVRRDVTRFSGSETFTDDFTLIVIRAPR
jgi:sigma-B regulation protein RsbU (phosphoserine phosphatase)